MSVTLDSLLEPLDHLLTDPSVEDILVNGPNNIYAYARGAFKRQDLKLDADDIEDIAIVAAAQRSQDFSHRRPILSIDIKDGRGRLQAITYPCVPEDSPCLVIRRGSSSWPTMEQLMKQGLFEKAVGDRRVKRDEELLKLYHEGSYGEFLSLAVRKHRTVIACGQVASGKTFLSKALIGEIPRDERLVVIEDAQELLDLPHENAVALFCKKDPGDGDITPTHLVEAALRMRMNRLFMQELRDGNAANAFLIALQTGHPGAITTVHAPHCTAVFDRLRVMISQTPQGRGVRPEDVQEQLHSLIDVIIHLSLGEGGVRKVEEVWFKDAFMNQG
jgi:type IV secretion system protein VirB11